MGKELELDLKSAIISTGLLQPVSSQSSRMSVSVLCRQVQGQETAWLETLKQLLEAGEATGSTFHICRKYLLKDGKLVYGWHFQIESKSELKAKLEVAKSVLAKAQPSLAVEEEEPKPVLQSKLPKAHVKPAAPGQHPKKQAVPRPPAEEAVVEEPPDDFEFKIRTVEDRIDEGGKRRIVQEVPLPHVYSELNVPTKPKFDQKLGRFVGGAKGATYTGT